MPTDPQIAKNFILGKKLAIVVPYRDRAEHLQQLLHHFNIYFQRDKLDSHIHVEFMVVEQGNNKAFNAGALRNIGFSLSQSSCDYVCFHDVDYLPIFADYSYPKSPSRLVWYGAETKQVDEQSKRYVRHSYDTFFGGVIMFRNDHFRQLNGFSNDYWGWGFEDVDMLTRCANEGLAVNMRDGTYTSLAHKNSGFTDKGSLSEVAQRNKALFEVKRTEYQQTASYKNEGLSTLNFEVVSRGSFNKPQRGAITVKRVVVDF